MERVITLYHFTMAIDRLAELELEREKQMWEFIQKSTGDNLPSQIRESAQALIDEQLRREKRAATVPEFYDDTRTPYHAGSIFAGKADPEATALGDDQFEKEGTYLLNFLNSMPSRDAGRMIQNNPNFMNQFSAGGNRWLDEVQLFVEQHKKLPRNLNELRARAPLQNLESGGRIDEIAVEEEQPSTWGPEIAEFLLSLAPSEDKSIIDNLLSIGPWGIAGKTAGLPLAAMKMAKGKTYGGGFAKEGYTKIRGGGKSNTLKTRSPEAWETYRDITNASRGGSNPSRLTPEQIEALRDIMPQLRAAAKNTKRHGRQQMKNIVDMFDENF